MSLCNNCRNLADSVEKCDRCNSVMRNREPNTITCDAGDVVFNVLMGVMLGVVITIAVFVAFL